MFNSSAPLLIAAVAAVGVLHTIVPDHWVPIMVIARRNGWSKGETARAALQAGTGHILSTLLLAVIVWLVGVAAAEHLGQIVDTAASLALIALGVWVALSAWFDLRRIGTRHAHPHPHGGGHGPDYPTAATESIAHEHVGHEHDDWIEFAEDRHHEHGHRHPHGRGDAYDCAAADDLYAPLNVAVAVRHRHVHRHGENAPPHTHLHDHLALDAHPISQAMEFDAPLHRHRHKTRGRIALLLILGSSPMIEGIPAFFAAERYGAGLLVAMAAVLAMSTIATYVLLCVYSTAGLQRVRFGPLERYGEVLSGGVIAAVGLALWVWPVI